VIVYGGFAFYIFGHIYWVILFSFIRISLRIFMVGRFFIFFGSPLGIEEVEDVFDLEELAAEVVVDDNKCEDVAAIDQNDEPVEQGYNGECVL
jgi:hypothetical protein